MIKLIIIRGVSGSGKSSIAQHLGGFAGLNWFEADMYFQKDGEYKFDPRKLGQAHVWCQTKTIEALYDKTINHVIVSNTSTTIAEANTYIEIAKRANADCEVFRTPGPWNPAELFRRNKHNVPLATLEKQIARYTPVDEEIEWSDLSIFKTGVK